MKYMSMFCVELILVTFGTLPQAVWNMGESTAAGETL